MQRTVTAMYSDCRSAAGRTACSRPCGTRRGVGVAAFAASSYCSLASRRHGAARCGELDAWCAEWAMPCTRLAAGCDGWIELGAIASSRCDGSLQDALSVPSASVQHTHRRLALQSLVRCFRRGLLGLHAVLCFVYGEFGNRKILARDSQSETVL